MTVKEILDNPEDFVFVSAPYIKIIEEYLQSNNFDGLCKPDGECGCVIGFLVPCIQEDVENCVPGHKVPCDCGQGCEFHIKEGKEQ